MTPEEFLNGLKKAWSKGKTVFIVYGNDGKHAINKISALGNLEKIEIEGSTISFKEASLPQCQYYDTDLIEKVYVAEKMT